MSRHSVYFISILFFLMHIFFCFVIFKIKFEINHSFKFEIVFDIHIHIHIYIYIYLNFQEYVTHFQEFFIFLYKCHKIVFNTFFLLTHIESMSFLASLPPVLHTACHICTAISRPKSNCAITSTRGP
jgi:hypothetical protein